MGEPDAIASLDIVRRDQTHSAAVPVHRKERGAGKINHLPAEAAVARDPSPNPDWIKIPKRSCRGIVDGFESEKTRTPCGVKAEDRFRRHANPIMRHDAEHHRAGRIALSVDNDIFVGIPQRYVARPVSANSTAAVVDNTNSGRCGCRDSRERGRSERGCSQESP